jgi:hypothetical protein
MLKAITSRIQTARRLKRCLAMRGGTYLHFIAGPMVLLSCNRSREVPPKSVSLQPSAVTIRCLSMLAVAS